MPVLQWFRESQTFTPAAAGQVYLLAAASCERIFLRIALLNATTLSNWTTIANNPQSSSALAPTNTTGSPWLDFTRATHPFLVQQEFWGFSSVGGIQAGPVIFEIFEYDTEQEYSKYSAKPRRRNRLDADHLDDRVDYQSSLARRLANAIARLTHGRS